MTDFEVFRRFVQHVRIVHHIPGRVRFKLLDLALDEEGKALLGQAKQFEHALDGIQGVKSIRLNLLARSCTVEYDKAVIPQDAWQDVLEGAESAAAESLLGILRTRYRELTQA